MEFIPIGGFPSIVRKEDTHVNKNITESRGFGTTNIVNIADIMGSKAKEQMFIAFGTDQKEEGGILSDDVDLMGSILFSENPNIYDGIEYKEVSNDLKMPHKKSN